MKIVTISDTHRKLHKVNLPDGDILLHAGDWSFVGDPFEVQEFNDHLGAIKHKYKNIIVIPGNHDWLAEIDRSFCREILTNATLLIDETVEIEGLKIYGSPWQPEFCNWAFNLDRASGRLKEVWDAIPANTDVLVTHGPPLGIMDICPDGSQVGCYDLANRIKELPNLKLHVFGHIHHSRGHQVINGVNFVNASICTEKYEPINKPIVIEL